MLSSSARSPARAAFSFWLGVPFEAAAAAVFFPPSPEPPMAAPMTSRQLLYSSRSDGRWSRA